MSHYDLLVFIEFLAFKIVRMKHISALRMCFLIMAVTGMACYVVSPKPHLPLISFTPVLTSPENHSLLTTHDSKGAHRNLMVLRFGLSAQREEDSMTFSNISGTIEDCKTLTGMSISFLKAHINAAMNASNIRLIHCT
jgi:hypothetical protein